MTIKNQITGFDSLNHFLNNFSKGVRSEILEYGGRQAGKLVKDEIVTQMGRAFNAHSGNLHKPVSIAVNVKTKGNDVHVSVGPKKKRFYAYFLEFGTEKMKARPFMRPAFDIASPKVLAFFRKKVFKRAISRARRGGLSIPTSID